MDIFKIQEQWELILSPHATEESIDALYKCVTELALYEKTPLDMSRALLHAALAMMLAHNKEQAETLFKEELRIMMKGIEKTSQYFDMKDRTKAIEKD